MSSLLHPIHGTRDRFRPKHQVLVLKCYPKYQKNVQEVKPNSSELSYLLYYASSRRNKLTKIGAFLEKKTASDVWRVKLGNVQVTLQILSSIIEKSPRDLALYANSVLSVLNTVLDSKNIDMIEESVPTFETYCKYADAASLAADQGRTKQYKSIVQQYAAFGQLEASTTQPVPISTRRRTIALKATRAVVGSDALAVDTSDQLNAVMPLILENLDLEKGSSLIPLQQRASSGEKQSMELARKRRMSSATVPSVDEVASDPATAAETTADADKAAEEEVRVLAIRCLKQIFSLSTGASRVQMRLATSLVLKYIATRERPKPSSRSDTTSSHTPDWATSLFETIARWTPVQDRFIIVITAVETLVRSPIVEVILEKQLILASLIDWLLRSDINLIGLSVMDVLLRLIDHTLLLLQLGSREMSTNPQPSGADTLGLYRDIAASFDPGALPTKSSRGRMPDSKEMAPSPVRRELLTLLQKCISDLATHIYYTDQISDMLTAIMARLKPSATSDVPTAAAAVNDPAAATKAIATSAHLQEDPSTDGFFSFATARVVALKAVKDILRTANVRRSNTGSTAEVRSRVGVQVWDGTQWLLKDADSEVRVAYVDAIITWLRLETNRTDMLLPKDGLRKPRSAKRDTNGEVAMAKRAVSNASRKGDKQSKSTFLQLLHLAIYDQAVNEADNEPAILLLYLLLWTLIERLGVNAVRNGLPMMLGLQSTVLNSDDHSPTAKARIASLVHGYLWAIAEKLDFESSSIGSEINAEISRRKRFGCWSDRVRFPPLGLAQIGTGSPHEKANDISEVAVNTIRPFLNVDMFVSEVGDAYDRSLVSPASSPPSSPGRVFSVPTLGFGYGYNAGPVHKPSPENQIPQKIKDEMCGSWSREACMALADKESNPSMTGSRTAASSTGRQHLSVAGKSNGIGFGGRNIPQDSESNPSPTQAQAPPLTSGLGSLSRVRNYSTASSLRDPETSSRDSTMRMSDLKRALAGTNGGIRGHSPLRRLKSRSRQSAYSSGSDSMVSWNPADDDSLGDVGTGLDDKTTPNTRLSIAVNQVQNPIPAQHQEPGQPISTYHDLATFATDPNTNNGIPPVPKIPSALNLPMAGTWPRDTSPARHSQNIVPPDSAPTNAIPSTGLPHRPDTSSTNTLPKPEKSRTRTSRPASRAGGNSIWSHSTTGRKTDLHSLLASIKVDASAEDEEEERELVHSVTAGKVIKPPY
ncbi:plasma membrane localization protein [Lithohypha guttulata]|uniref:plasma membrane localization protein n=1 Tax=Lithohypha guttulata TaxID=1690604 RepID=UPI002DDED1FC|nr:plasma membrane localization protein [Lithohypha guttulata]